MSNEAKHTPGAMKVSKIILNGKKLIETSYGDKNADGIADLIDRETAALDLLAACTAIVAHRDWMISLGGAKRELSPDLVKRLAAVMVDIHAQVESAIAKAVNR